LGDRAASIETSVDCRYAGQGHELTVREVAAFAAEHRRRNGFSTPGSPIEVVALRATARGASPAQTLPDPVPARAGILVGPAVLAESDCTIWVAPGWTARPGGGGAWVLERPG
jgi:N-methylhydantoinase A/oxoprolinase/acetone carboxylase beta subunit